MTGVTLHSHSGHPTRRSIPRKTPCGCLGLQGSGVVSHLALARVAHVEELEQHLDAPHADVPVAVLLPDRDHLDVEEAAKRRGVILPWLEPVEVAEADRAVIVAESYSNLLLGGIYSLESRV